MTEKGEFPDSVNTHNIEEGRTIGFCPLFLCCIRDKSAEPYWVKLPDMIPYPDTRTDGCVEERLTTCKGAESVKSRFAVALSKFHDNPSSEIAKESSLDKVKVIKKRVSTWKNPTRVGETGIKKG